MPIEIHMNSCDQILLMDKDSDKGCKKIHTYLANKIMLRYKKWGVKEDYFASAYNDERKEKHKAWKKSAEDGAHAELGLADIIADRSINILDDIIDYSFHIQEFS